MAMAVLKIFSSKVSYCTMLYELTKMNVFFHLSLGVAEILCVGYQASVIHFVGRFFISPMAEELFLVNQGNSYVTFN